MSARKSTIGVCVLGLVVASGILVCEFLFREDVAPVAAPQRNVAIPREEPPEAPAPRVVDAPTSPRATVAGLVRPSVGSIVEGRVLDSEGTTIENAHVVLDVFDPTPNHVGEFAPDVDAFLAVRSIDARIVQHLETTSDTHGNFRFTDVVESDPNCLSLHRDRVTVDAKGYATTAAYPFLRRAVDIELKRRDVVLVTVREDANDELVRNEVVAIVGNDGKAQVTTTDDTGRFRTQEPLTEGSATFVLFRPGHGVVATTAAVRGNLAEVEFPSYPTYVLSFVDADDSTTLSGVLVHDLDTARFEATSVLARPIGASDAAGELRIDDLQPTSGILVERRGYAPRPVLVAASKSGFNAIEKQTIEMTKTVSVKGRLIDRFGKPLAEVPVGDPLIVDFAVTYFAGARTPLPAPWLGSLLTVFPSERAMGAARPTTDHEGRFAIEVRASQYVSAITVGEPQCPAYRTALRAVKPWPPGSAIDLGEVSIDPSALVPPETKDPDRDAKFVLFPVSADGQDGRPVANACFDVLVQDGRIRDREELAGFGFTDSNGNLRVLLPKAAYVVARAVHFDGFQSMEFRFDSFGRTTRTSGSNVARLSDLAPVRVTLTDAEGRAPKDPLEIGFATSDDPASRFAPYGLERAITVAADGSFVLRFPRSCLSRSMRLAARRAGSRGDFVLIGSIAPEAAGNDGRESTPIERVVDARKRWR